MEQEQVHIPGTHEVSASNNDEQEPKSTRKPDGIARSSPNLNKTAFLAINKVDEPREEVREDCSAYLGPVCQEADLLSKKGSAYFGPVCQEADLLHQEEDDLLRQEGSAYFGPVVQKPEIGRAGTVPRRFSESEVTGIFKECGGKNDNKKIELLSQAYHLVCGGAERDFSSLKEIKTPILGNTILHIAAWHGNNHVVDMVAKHAPHLLFTFNENKDTPLHVAARAGNIRTVEKLLATYADFERDEIVEACDLWELVKMKNISEGNTMLHEAMLCEKKGIGANVFKAFEPYKTKDREGDSLSESRYKYALNVVNHAKQSVLYVAVKVGDYEAVNLILEKGPQDNDEGPTGSLSPVVAAIMKRDGDMLNIILRKRPNWIHLTDKHKRLALHYAASTGYLKGVQDLLDKCKCCSIQKDKYGYLPLHLASHGGHVEVVEELLKDCSDPTEMLDSSKRNILHIAANSGKHEVVRYILRTADEHRHYYEMMIDQRDSNGDTPLHLATRSLQPKAVNCLTWDKRVDLGVVNQKKETALDIANALYEVDKTSLRQLLTWTALKSAGAKASSSTVLPVECRPSDLKSNKKLPSDSNKELHKDRVEPLLTVSTLIITASVAACLAVPGESSDNGKANNLHHPMFIFFIICVTISLFSSISATIILFWARLGFIELLVFSLKLIMPLLGAALIFLFLAFLAGIYTVISELSWLATLFLTMTLIFVVIVCLLYILLLLPSFSTSKPLRYISYYPFLFLASLAEPKTDIEVIF